MRGASVILRRVVGLRAPCLAARSSSIGDDLIVSSAAAAAASYSTLILAEDARPLFATIAASGAVSDLHLSFVNQSRNFSSAASSDMRYSQIRRKWYQSSLRNSFIIQFAKLKRNLSLQYFTSQQLGAAPVDYYHP
ncbi:thioredoxin O2, mitochondrial-like [Salvia divinorum]|uniref:Thioredoxin O2, mitochondrial-like n=1 Tax=Salvia divinorum TaxID=28513 RepID=A0ABD1G2Y5_SALDI